MKRQTSDIPQGVTEVQIREYSAAGQVVFFRVMECVLDGRVVGQRAYDWDGKLRIETPIRDGKKHGREYIWSETGALESVEPYRDGKRHGLAKQYGRKGNLIGTYRFIHGTGFDIWRWEQEDGSTFVSEVFTVQDGTLHGYEWWLNADQRSVWHERHWQRGRLHGIERMWNENGRLKRGYPKYWVQDRAVNKRVYLRSAGRDESLPKYRDSDNHPQRTFPSEIERTVSKK